MGRAQTPRRCPALLRQFAALVFAAGLACAGAGPAEATQDGGWVLDIRDHGARCDGATDDTAAIQAVLDLAARAPFGVAVFSPPGRCMLSAGLHVTLHGTTSLRLYGASRDASEWVFTGDVTGLSVVFGDTGASGVQGGFWLRNPAPDAFGTAPAPGNSLVVDDIGFITAYPPGPASGTAIAVRGDNVSGRPSANSQFTNIAFHGLTQAQTWAVGLDLFKVSQADIDNIVWTGQQAKCSQPAGGVGIHLAGVRTTHESAAYAIRNYRATCAQVALSIGDGIQGVSVAEMACTAITCIGWHVPEGPMEDALQVSNSQLSYTGAGISAERVANVLVTNTYFLPGPGSTGIRLVDAPLSNLHGNSFRGGAAGETGIALTQTRAVPAQYTTLIAANVFANLGAAAIQFDGYAGTSTISGNAFQSNHADYIGLPAATAVAANGQSGAAVIGADGQATVVRGVGSIPLGAIVDRNRVWHGVRPGQTVTEARFTDGDLLTCPVATLASLTVVLPPAPVTGQTFTLASQCTVSALSIQTAPGAPRAGLAIGASPARIVGGAPGLTLIYNRAGNAWYRWH